MNARLHRFVATAIACGVSFISTASTARAAVITFDDVTAPGLFSGAQPLTTQYSAQGVTFAGTGAVLNAFLSNFLGTDMEDPTNNIVGYSGLTPIGFMDDEMSLSQTFDVLTFSAPLSAVSFLVGPGLMNIGSTFNARAFNAADMLVDSTTLVLMEGFQQVTLMGTSITWMQFGIAADDLAEFAIDNLDLQGAATVPEPMTLTLLVSGLAAGAVVRNRRRQRP